MRCFVVKPRLLGLALHLINDRYARVGATDPLATIFLQLPMKLALLGARLNFLERRLLTDFFANFIE